MDGNGRWGLKNKNSRNAGHKAGLNTVEKIIKETVKNKIKFLTLYAFSTENWRRPKREINYLFKLLENFLTDKIEDLNKQDIRLKIIGIKSFSPKLNKLLDISEKKTFKNNKLQINLALNYGSKSELVNACKALVKNKDISNKKLSNKLNKKFISFLGLFQFSVENAYKVKKPILFLIVSLIIFSTVLKPAL